MRSIGLIWTYLPIRPCCGSKRPPISFPPSLRHGRRTSPMPTKQRLVLDDFLPYRLSIVTNRASAAIALHYSKRFGLSIPEWRVMAVLGETPGLSARQVTERAEMDKV